MARSHLLQAENLVSGYDSRMILDQVNLTVPSNRISVIIGANGCGKSTLLKTLVRLLKPASGHALLDGKSIHGIPSKQLARTMGLLPQSPIVPEGIRVADLVGRGRFPHQSLFGTWTRQS